MTASEILVIFLSVALALFLVLAIILVIYLIVIAKRIKEVAETAERTVAHFEGLAAMVSKAAAPAVVSKFVIDTLGRFMKRNNKNEEDEQ
ncbi:MAG TPA: hypothetical protein VLG40_04290 [Candidatus Saccharimonas sp.]|nr:hypothetical protein [Candidatus Saccharimonas sp.]